jgi:uncharacterized membrane protein YraQ (UPF0718 family)
MVGFFGWKIALLYAFSGIILGVICGVILGRMKLERHLEQDIIVSVDMDQGQSSFVYFKDRLKYGWSEAMSILQKIWIWVLAGVALGAAIHNYIPQSMIDGVMATTGLWSVPLATVVGVPMYGSCAAIVPVAVVLFQKGVPLGTALAFMMAVSALSLPEAIMLRRAMRLPLILIFFAITTLGIIMTGYLFNGVQTLLIK